MIATGQANLETSTVFSKAHSIRLGLESKTFPVWREESRLWGQESDSGL